jgi:hypothetical protein
MMVGVDQVSEIAVMTDESGRVHTVTNSIKPSPNALNTEHNNNESQKHVHEQGDPSSMIFQDLSLLAGSALETEIDKRKQGHSLLIECGLIAMRRRWKIAKRLFHHQEEQRENDLKDTFDDKKAVNDDNDNSSVEETYRTQASKSKENDSKVAFLSIQACVQIGQDLCEALVLYQKEGYAATVLEECLILSGIPKLSLPNNSPHTVEDRSQRDKTSDSTALFTQGKVSNVTAHIAEQKVSVSLLLLSVVSSLTMTVMMRMSILTSVFSASCSFYSYTPHFPSPSPSFTIHYCNIRLSPVSLLMM